MTDIIRLLLPDEVDVKEANPQDTPTDTSILKPEERVHVERAVDARKREFITGRILARKAMARFGRGHSTLLPGKDRAPIWPLGLIGSISHTAAHCAAAVACTRDVHFVGVDVEADTPLPSEILEIVLNRPGFTGE